MVEELPKIIKTKFESSIKNKIKLLSEKLINCYFEIGGKDGF